MKDMWKRPQCKIDGRSRLYGWLFIYFGSTIESIICPIVERDLSRVNSNIIKDRKGNKKDIEDIIIYEILPLLEEYWYDDPDSIIQWKDALTGVLND